MPDFVQWFDDEPRFWQFLGGLRNDDLLIELIQNDLDANALHTTITFSPDILICTGDGERVDASGWRRLSFILGAGDRVEAKHAKVGVKNHGLKACFRIGDTITLRSDGQKTVQTLYKDGPSKPPSPGAWDEPGEDEGAPLSGCSVEVPYRKGKIKVSKGEPVEFDPVTDELIERLFREACDQLPTRLMGVVRPAGRGLRDKYTLTLNHHRLGSVELRWEAKRGKVNGTGRRESALFSRECHVSSNVRHFPSQVIREQAYTFKAAVPPGTDREIPAFFMPERRTFIGEVAWSVGKANRPEATDGMRRYPIGYAFNSQSARSGVGVHFSGPYISDAERHGVSESEWNRLIDDACKDALIEAMATYLLPRHGGRAMELYLITPANSEALKDLVTRTLQRGALPLRQAQDGRHTRSSNRYALGPRKNKGRIQQVVLPCFTWDQCQVSPLLAEVCPRTEDQIDPTTPAPILQLLAKNTAHVITFDENDVIERLQPLVQAQYFPWGNEAEWRASLGDLSIAKRHLDVVLKTAQKKRITSEEEVAQRIHLPDYTSCVRPLAEMFAAVSLPPDLGRLQSVALLNSELKAHPLFKRPAWKLRRFTFLDYLNKAQMETSTIKERETFWRWLRDNRRAALHSRELCKIVDLPVWPSRNRSLLRLSELCEPTSRSIASVLGDAIKRPSGEVLNSGLVKISGRGCGVIRSTPTEEEIEDFLSRRFGKFPTDCPLTNQEQQDFHKLENEVALLGTVPQIKQSLINLSGEYAVALAKDGYLRKPGDLNRSSGKVAPLHLLPRHMMDRPQKKLDQLRGWAPQSFPRSDQIVEALTEDPARIAAHVNRLQAYLEQTKREGITPNGLSEVPCIPVNGVPHSPNALVLRGSQDYWGDWKTAVPLAGVNPEMQRLYESVGVTGRVPTHIDSVHFFQWLAQQPPAITASHLDQILRHINHKQGPSSWCGEYPTIAFIPVEYGANDIKLLTKSEATKPRSNIAIPDFEALERQIRTHSGKYPVGLAIVASRRVTHPINSELRNLGVRTLSGLAKDPIGVHIDGSITPYWGPLPFDSLRKGRSGQQLPKRLERSGLDQSIATLKSNWREHLAQIGNVKVAESVRATYKIARTNVSVETSGELDKQSGILYLMRTSDLERSLYESIANLIFELPKPFFGGALKYALDLEMLETDGFSASETIDPTDFGLEDTENHDPDAEGIAAAGGRHLPVRPSPQRNLPKPGPIPSDSASRSSKSRGGSASSRRPASSRETDHISDLRENQYAWHCQACLAKWRPEVLTPPRSYVEHHQNRRGIMEAHHCDQVSAGGADHAGNLLLLCRYHHLELGDAISRAEVTQGLKGATPLRRTFHSADGASTQVQGYLPTVRPPQRKRAVRLFFTGEHRDYWLQKADEEGLV